MRHKLWLVSAVAVLLLGYGIFLRKPATSVMAQTSTPSPESEVSVADATAFGSTGTKVRVFNTVVENIGSDITYTSDAVNGDYFTINNNGVYAVTYVDGTPNSEHYGVSLNLAATSSFDTAWGTGKELCFFGEGNNGGSCSVVVLLAQGDVLRAHTNNGTGPNAQTVGKFIVVRVH